MLHNCIMFVYRRRASAVIRVLTSSGRATESMRSDAVIPTSEASYVAIGYLVFSIARKSDTEAVESEMLACVCLLGLYGC